METTKTAHNYSNYVPLVCIFYLIIKIITENCNTDQLTSR